MERMTRFFSGRNSFKDWLENNRPSNVITESKIQRIVVKSPVLEAVGPDIEGSRKDWYEFTRSNQEITSKIFVTLAKAHNNLQGKWMIHVDSTEVDKEWNTVATGILAGNLGSLCTGSSVCKNSIRDEFVVNVVNSDFTNKVQIKKVENALRKIGIEKNLIYKPEIYEHLGIFPSNCWDIFPSIYLSEYNPDTKASSIIVRPLLTSDYLPLASNNEYL